MDQVLQLLAAVGGVVAGIAATAGVVVSLMVYRRQGDDRPTISVRILPQQPAGWHKVHIWVKNPGNVPWDAVSLSVRRPRRARLVSEDDATVRDRLNSAVFDAEVAAQRLRRTVAMQLAVGAAGSWSDLNLYGSRDAHWEECFLFAPSARRVSMRFTLRSRDAKPRIMTIAIARELKPQATSARD